MSRFDFCSILAKAEKNSNQAQRVLEEKKALQKKSRPPGEAKSQPDTKALQVYLDKKREEQRLQNLKEQQEILRQRRLKDEANAKTSETSDKKKSATTVKSNGTSGVKSIKKPQSSAPVKQSATSSKRPSESLKSSSGPVKEKPRSSSAKPSLNHGKSFTESRPKPQGPPVSQPEQVKQPVRSYQDILKLAEARSASSAAQKPAGLASKDARKSDITANNSTAKSNQPNRPPFSKPDIGGLSIAAQNYLSQLRPDQILKLQQRQGLISRPRPNGAGVNTSNDKKISNSDAKLNNIINNKPTSVKPISNSGPGTARPMSTWDRLMADMKKNSTGKPISNKPRIDQPKRKQVEEYEDYYDDYDDDDEYDSDMDDFIDDTDGLDKSVTDEIRRLFRYDPKKYKHIDDEDIDNMESDFATIQREERQTLKLGMIEDAIELEREQEMERRRMEKKKRLDDTEYSKRSPEKKFKS